MTDHEPSYFDLHINGIGYLSRFREIAAGDAGRRHKPYCAVDIAALEGPTNDPTYTYFDARISGSDAIEVLTMHAAAINDREVKVLAAFRIGGVAPSIYQVRRGPHAGDSRVSLKTRLIRIAWIKVKARGETAYRLVHAEPAKPAAVSNAPVATPVATQRHAA
jgi:hypothetical protein